MIFATGIVIGVIVAGFPVFVLRGLALFARRRWSKGLANTAGGLACLLGGVLVLGLAARYLVPLAGVDPSEKARVLAEGIAELMNCSAWVTILMGVPGGLVTAVVTYRRAAVQQ